MIRLLAIDIDGTLLDSRGRLPDVHRDALVEASARGIDVALVTGRSFHFTRPVADLLPIPPALIVNNGAVVKRKNGETELRHLLSRHAARQILSETRAYEDSVALVFDRPAERQIVFERMDWSHANRRGYYDKNQAYIARVSSPLAEVLSEDPIQVMFNGSVEPMRALVAALGMGNATDAIKARGYRLTGTNDEGGLATAIRLHALDQHKGHEGHED